MALIGGQGVMWLVGWLSDMWGWSEGSIFCWKIERNIGIIGVPGLTLGILEGDVPGYTFRPTFYIIAVVLLWGAGLLSKAFGLAESTGADGSNAQAVWALGETGEGINVGLISQDNTRVSHEAFRDKDSNGLPIGPTYADANDFTGDGIVVTNHDTWVAGVVASRGGQFYPDDKGVAPGSYLYSAKVVKGVDPNLTVSYYDLAEALDWLVVDHNCLVIFSGIALSSLTPDGDSDWTLLYDYYAYQYGVVFANPAGNENTQIAVFGDAYNGITTGGLLVTDPDVYNEVGDSSGSGPTADNRNKPDVVGPSQDQTMPGGLNNTYWNTVSALVGETSYSTPHAAGVAALLLGLADDTAEPNDGHSEVVRAVIVNSTFANIDDKSGGWTDPGDPNNTWDTDRGYGRVDALRAYELLDANRVVPDVNITQQKGWAFGTIGTLQEHVYTIYAERNERLVATLTWDRRVEWVDEDPIGPEKKNELIDFGELDAYLANLDLVVYNPSGPNAIFSEDKYGLDPDNNLEKCDLLLESTGDYVVKVVNKSSSESPNYAIAFEILPPIVGDFEPIDYVVDYGDFLVMSGDWLAEGLGLEADLVVDGANTVDERDFAEFGYHWGQSDPVYSGP